MTLECLRIVLDCAHGAAYKSTPAVLQELGAELMVSGVQPNGTNINAECGSMHPASLCNRVREYRADLGIAHDGDADRVILCDENGSLIDGDDILAISGLQMLREGTLKKKTLVATVMSNAGLDAAIQAAGGSVIRTAVGDKNVIDRMLADDLNLGGEQSGHLIFRDHSTTGDGLVAALQVLAVVQRQGRPVSEVCRLFEPVPQILKNVRHGGGQPLQAAHVKAAIADGESKLGKSGRLVIRPSGTEPVIRVMAEGDDHAQVEAVVDQICDALRDGGGAKAAAE
jgi:phosphoglucosamine mutase